MDWPLFSLVSHAYNIFIRTQWDLNDIGVKNKDI